MFDRKANLRKAGLEEGLWAPEGFPLQGKVGFVKRVYALCLDDPENVIVYSPSPMSCAGRNRFMGYVVPPEEVCKDWAIISRVIIHPRYRSIGLGTRLLRETLPLVCEDTGVRYVEAIAVMARYNPFFAKAMLEVPYESSYRKACCRILELLKPLGFEPALAASEDYNLRILKGLKPKECEKVARVLGSYRILFGDLYGRHFPDKERFFEDLKESKSLAAAIRKASLGAQLKKYYVWTPSMRIA